MSWLSRVKKGWNAIKDSETHQPEGVETLSGLGNPYSVSPGRHRRSFIGDRSIMASILTRLAIDTSLVEFRHARIDDEERYLEDMPSSLNDVLKVSANIDQAAQAFRIDMAYTLMERGHIAIVPTDTSSTPREGNSYDIEALRVGEVIEWLPRHVRVRVYDDRAIVGGQTRDIVLPKEFVGIVENPFYSVMNEPNSTLQRLIKILSQIDYVNEYASSGKLDLLIKLPYVIKSESRREQANKRRQDIEMQLHDGKYGIAYIDGTENVTQLNRPVENNLLKQIESLREQLYSELGLTPAVFDGSADEAAMLNYQNRTIKPIVKAIAEEMKRKFLTRTARTQGQSIEFFTDPFELVPIADIAEIADKFTRNEIMSANEIRAIVGRKPAKDPKADELRNSNMPAPEDSGLTPEDGAAVETGGSLEMSALDEIDAEVSDLLSSLGVETDDGA